MCGAARPCGSSSSSGDELERGGAAVVEEGAVAEDALDDAEVARARHVEAEADRAGALLHLGVLDHAHGRLVGAVVDAGDLRVRVDGGLRRAVRLERAVPVEVVVGDVEARRSPTGAARPGPVVGRWCSW